MISVTKMFRSVSLELLRPWKLQRSCVGLSLGITAVFSGGTVIAGRGISSHPLEKETYVPKR